MDEIEDDGLREQGYHLVTSKYKHSLNSQFKRAKYAYVPTQADIKDGEKVEISSKYGSHIFEVRVDEGLREDTIMIYSGTSGVNYLTPDKLSEEGESAIYQDVKVLLKSV